MTQTGNSCDALAALAAEVLAKAKDCGVAVVTAESCTGGLVSSLLTDIEGMSSAFERGFTVYSNQAKAELLDIDPMLIERAGAVSEAVAVAMAEGGLRRSRGHVCVSITGFAGPGGDHDEEGLVHLAARSKEGRARHRECHFGAVGRDRVRELAARAALEMLSDILAEWQESEPHPPQV